jgi:RHS repeat-associated protein
MGTTVGNKDIATTSSGHTTMTPPAMSMIPPVPPGPGPVPALFPYTARTATATQTDAALEAGGSPVVVNGTILDVDPPANEPSRPAGVMDVVTHAVVGKANVTDGSSNTKANGKEVSATGDSVCVNVLIGPEKVSQEKTPLARAGGADMAGDKDGEEAEEGKEGTRATPAAPAKKCTDGHPVDVATGDVVDQAVDIALPGVIPFSWSRTYTSRAARERTSLGKGGWAHSYEQWVDEIDGVLYHRNAEGREVEFERVAPGSSAFNRRERLTLTAGHHGSYRIYDHRARLTSVFEPLSRDGPAMLRAIQDAYGHAIALEYEGGRLCRIVDTAGREVRVQNDAHGRVTRLEVWAAPPASSQDPSRSALPAPKPSLELWFDYAYNETGELASATNALGCADRYAYDGLHRMAKTTLKNGVSFSYTYDDETGWCVKTWGDGGLHTVELKPDFKKKTTHTSGGTEPRVYTWNDDGLVVREATLDGSFVREREYDAEHYLLSEANAAGETTSYGYDQLGNLMKIVDPAGNEAIIEHQGDAPVKRVGPDGLITKLAYDEHGALTGVTYPTGQSYALARDADGRLTAIYGADGLLLGFAYDSHHNTVLEHNARGARTRYVYDALGRPIERRDALGATTRLEYDRVGHATAAHFPDGSRTEAAYESLGNVCRVVDPLGGVTTIAYSGTGVVTEIVQPDGQRWCFSHNSEQRVQRIENPRGERYEFDHDAVGRVERERTYDGRILEYRYDKAGHLARIDYPDRTFREFSFDPLGNLVEERSPHGGISFERDALGRLSKATLEERNGKVVNTFVRDAYGRVIAETQQGRTFRYEYDAHSRRSARILPDGQVTRYYYDPLGALLAIDHEGHKLSLERDPLGREVRRHVYASQTDILSGYDAMGRLIEQQVVAPAAAGGALAVLTQRRLRYDAMGRVSDVEDGRWGAARYRYDVIGRLVQARCDKLDEAFEYDPAGSIVGALRRLGSSAEHEPWDVLPGNLLVKTGSARFEYDQRGRRIRKIVQAATPAANERITEYAWDCRDRLREVSLPSGDRVRFTYDAFARRVRKEIIPPDRSDYALMVRLAVEKGKEALPRTRVVEFCWDSNALALETSTEGGTRVFVHAPGTLVPMLQQEAGAVFTYVTNHRGVPTELLDTDGRVAWAANHSAWGEILDTWSDPKARLRVESPFRLLGHYADVETGLFCTRFRYLDPEVGRWCSPDPIGLAGGANLFAWDGTPVTAVDPLGLASNYLFRGDDNYSLGDPIGYPMGSEEANSADIQTPWDHVQGKNDDDTSRFTSFSTEEGRASKFGKTYKVSNADIAELEGSGAIKVLTPEMVAQQMREAGLPERKIRGVIQDMEKNKEVLIEGQIPGDKVKECK